MAAPAPELTLHHQDDENGLGTPTSGHAGGVEALSPGGQMRWTFDINSPKTAKPASTWGDSAGQGDETTDVPVIRRNDSGFALSADAEGGDRAARPTDATAAAPTMTLRSVSGAGVSTRTLVLVPNAGEAGAREDESEPRPAGGAGAGPSEGKSEVGGEGDGGTTPRAFRHVAKAGAASTGAGFTTPPPPQRPTAVVTSATAEEEPLPAGLAALLHQTDRSGMQQKAAPHPAAASGTDVQQGGAAGSLTAPVAPSERPRAGDAHRKRGISSLLRWCISPQAVDADEPGEGGQSGREGGGAGQLSAAAPAPGVHAQSGSAGAGGKGSVSSSGSASSASTSSASGGGGGLAAPAARPAPRKGSSEPGLSIPPPLATSASGALSARQGGGASRPLGAPSAGAGSDEEGAGGAPSPAPLTLRERGRREAGPPPGGEGDVAPQTPSNVLSPTSVMVRSTREELELYSKQGTPAWGSKHPTVIHAHYEKARMAQPSMSRTLFTGRGGAASMAGRRAGGPSGSYGPAGSGAAMAGMSPVAAMEKQVEAIYTPRRSRKLLYGPPAGHDEPPPCPHPRHRINNVRRPTSTAGDGPLLGSLMDIDAGKHCLVLDLDETLVHSSFKPVPNADYVLPVEIDGTTHYVYVIKRPGCEDFLTAVGERYEVVLFTASLSKYADPLLDLLDPGNVIRARLFREACVFHDGSYIKDMSLLGRSPASTIIVDNSPMSYLFQPENALPCDSFIDDPNDTELWALADFLVRVAGVADVRQALQQWTAGRWAGGSDLAYVHPTEGEREGSSSAESGAEPQVPSDVSDGVTVRTRQVNVGSASGGGSGEATSVNSPAVQRKASNRSLR